MWFSRTVVLTLIQSGRISVLLKQKDQIFMWVDNRSIAVRTFLMRMSTSLSVCEILLPRYMNCSIDPLISESSITKINFDNVDVVRKFGMIENVDVVRKFGVIENLLKASSKLSKSFIYKNQFEYEEECWFLVFFYWKKWENKIRVFFMAQWLTCWIVTM